MATYLLKAPDDDMSCWKRCAEELGMSFAAWLRHAANSQACKKSSIGLIDTRPFAPLLTKRTFDPDPK